MSFVTHPAVHTALAAGWRACLAFAVAMSAPPAMAGFNEGTGFGPSGFEMLFLAAFGLVTLPVGALLTYFRLETVFKAGLWLFGLCALAIVVAGVLLAGQLAMILVVMAAGIILPAFAFYFLGGILGRAVLKRRGVT